MLRHLLVFSVCLSLVPVAEARPRGYQSRACGLDMNRNGVIGEAPGADPLLEPGDCNVCDGGPNHPTHPETGTPDPDGDGVEEDLIYVDADNGNDFTGTGTALNPFRTVTAAWDQADGIANGIEDIVCFRGTSTEIEISPPENYRGLEETYTVPASGSDARDWLYPAQPTMLVGWDHDNDGCYPPHDDGSQDTVRCGVTGDVAEFSGNTVAARRAMFLEEEVKHLEVAHLTFSDYGRLTSETDSGFVKFSRNSDHDHIYFHDLELFRINMSRSSDSNIIAINLFNTNLHWVNFTNLRFQANGGWFVRGVPHQSEVGQTDTGPLRFKGITRVMRADDNGAATGFKPWGYITGVEVLDSIFDLNSAAWTPLPGTGNSTAGLLIVQCNQDWVVRNNEFIDFYGGIRVDGSSDGFCDNGTARPTQNIVIDGNILRNTYPNWGFGHYGITIQSDEPGDEEGDAAGEVVGNVTIINNMLSSVGTNAWESCISVSQGNDAAPVPGRIRVVNNTCYGPIRRAAGASILIGAPPDVPPQFQNFLQQNFDVYNNVVDGLNDDDHSMVLGYLPNNWNSDHNVFDVTGRYARWNNGNLGGFGTLAGWRSFSGEDGDSRECTPTFVSEVEGDFHLTGSDTCARFFGDNQSGLTTRDVDGDLRPDLGPWDVGADERVNLLFRDGFESGDTFEWDGTF